MAKRASTISKTPHLDALPRAQRKEAVGALRNVAKLLTEAGYFGQGVGGRGGGGVVSANGSVAKSGHRFYKSAGTGSARERRGWADRKKSDLLPKRLTLTEMYRGDASARCLDLKRNNTLARTLANRVCDHTIGDGWVFEFNSGDKEYDKRAEERANEFSDRVGLVWAIRGATEAGMFEGDRLIHKVNEGGVTLLDEIEGARIVTPDESGKKALGYDNGEIIVRPNGNTIVAGVERDRFGRTVQFHVAAWGDEERAAAAATKSGKDARSKGLTTGGSLGLGTVVPIPAQRCVFMKWPLLGEPGQTRGEPALQASLPRFFLIDKFIGDVLIAADMATLFGLIMKCANPAAQRKSDGEQLTDIIDAAEAVASGVDPEMVLEAGMIKWIGNLDSVEQVKPAFPEVNTRDFIMANAQIIGAEHNMPLALFLYDFGGLTASNARMIMSIKQRGDFAIQDWQVNQGVRPLVEWDLATAIARGELALPKGVDDPARAWKSVTITPPAPPVANLKEELEAYAFGREKNLLTGRWCSRQLGVGKFEDNLDIIEAEKKLERKKQIAPVLMPGAKDGAAGGGSAGAGKSGGDEEGADPAADPAEDPAADPAAVTAAKPPADVNAGKTAFLVGDKTAAIDIAARTKAGQITREAGLAVLTDLVGLDEATASRIATEADPMKAQAPSDGGLNVGGGAA